MDFILRKAGRLQTTPELFEASVLERGVGGHEGSEVDILAISEVEEALATGLELGKVETIL